MLTFGIDGLCTLLSRMSYKRQVLQQHVHHGSIPVLSEGLCLLCHLLRLCTTLGLHRKCLSLPFHLGETGILTVYKKSTKSSCSVHSNYISFTLMDAASASASMITFRLEGERSHSDAHRNRRIIAALQLNLQDLDLIWRDNISAPQ